MKVIERYIFGRGFVIFLGALAATLSIVWITQALLRINLVTTSGQSAATFFHIATLILPSVVPEVLPFAVAIAVAQTFAAMNADSELVVVNAAGSPRSAIIRPILLLALAASIASFIFANVIDPAAKLKFRTLLASANADLISLVLQEGTFREIEEGLYIQVGEQLPGGDLGGIFLADSRQKDIDLIYYAKKGSVIDTGTEKILLMREGVIQRKAPGGDVSVIRFDSYAFDLSLFTAASGGFVMFPKDRTLAYLLDPDPNDSIFQRVPMEFRAELHRRLAEWTYPLVFALIGLAVAGDARSHRQGGISPIITVMTIVLVVRWLGFMSFNMAETSGPALAAIYAVPLTASAIALWFIRTNRALELPTAWVDTLTATFSRFRDRMALFGMRLRGAAAERR